MVTPGERGGGTFVYMNSLIEKLGGPFAVGTEEPTIADYSVYNLVRTSLLFYPNLFVDAEGNERLSQLKGIYDRVGERPAIRAYLDSKAPHLEGTF
jgi:glutathione S-transferase